MKIRWDEDEEFEGIEPEGDEIPRYALSSNKRYAAALIQGQHDYRFQEPIWLHADSAFELHEAGIIEMHPMESADVDGTTVYIYVTP